MSDTRGREVRGRRLSVHAAQGLEKRRQSRSPAQSAESRFPARRAGEWDSREWMCQTPARAVALWEM
ncbi:MAG: hypothetical protein LBK73_15380 [Treponema sp.]|nr:hypothetical protein [Treponema sp.]